MSTVGAPCPAASSVSKIDDAVTEQRAVVVYNCNRLGRTANPPGFSLSDWFRPRRRR